MKRLFEPNAPFRPAAFPFFYGWVIVAAGTASMLFSLPGQTAGVGPFKEHLMAALQIDSMQLSIAYMVGTVASGLTLPLMGGLFDRVGARKVGVVASIALGLSLIFMSQIDRVMTAILGEPVAWMAMALVILGFFLIRFWGQGVFSIVSRAMIGKWFDRKRGIASAISGVPVAIAFTSALLILLYAIELMGGWRQAWAGMGIFLLVFSSVFCWLVFRDNPEECGLEMDGGYVPPKDNHNAAEWTIHREFTAKEAMGTMAFWVFSLAVCLNGFVGTAMGFHAQTLAPEMGMQAEELYKLFAETIFVNVPVSFIVGWMTSRFRLKYIYIITIVGLALGMVAFYYLPATWAKWAFVICFGVSWGTYGTLLTVTWPRYYGRRHLGKISSWVMTLLVVTSALGPVAFDGFQVVFGAYRTAIPVCLVMSFVLFVLCFFSENPQRKLGEQLGQV